MTGDDPNEAYEVVPIEPEKAELYPEYRASLITGRAWVKATGK
jgi:hypothetical protein